MKEGSEPATTVPEIDPADEKPQEESCEEAGAAAGEGESIAVEEKKPSAMPGLFAGLSMPSE